MKRKFIMQRQTIIGTIIVTNQFNKIHQITQTLKKFDETQLPSHISRIRKSTEKVEILIFVGQCCIEQQILELLEQLVQFKIEKLELVLQGLEQTDANWNYQFSSFQQQQKILLHQQSQFYEQIVQHIHLLLQYDAILIYNDKILLSVKNNQVFFEDKCYLFTSEQIGMPNSLIDHITLICRGREILIKDKSMHFLTDCILLVQDEPNPFQAGCLLHSRIKSVIYMRSTDDGVMNDQINYGMIQDSNHKFMTFILNQ